jgi:diguanylate cyclase (GGDEF)-like protein
MRTLSAAALFAGTSLIGSLTATALLIRLDHRDLTLRRVHSVMRILACLLPACFTAALCGAALVKIQFDGSATQTLMTWPASELVNYLIVLPAMLTVAPRWSRFRQPVLALAVSCAAAVYFDGPGSIMFPMPALLLCALTYPLPTTAMLTMVLGTGCLTTIGLGVVNIGQDMAIPAMVVSIRIAVAFLVLVPLTISSAMAVRNDLLGQLRAAADHDGLTGLLNRCAFEQRMENRLKQVFAPGKGLAMLWLDVDHFKTINDDHGHLAGDAVLRAFARIARCCCGDDDLVGRVGGEEFALVVDASGPEEAAAVAEHLRQAFAAHLTPWNDIHIRATVSIGACYLDQPERGLPELLSRLDEALYCAKRNGRNRIEWLQHRADPGSMARPHAQAA